MLFIAKMQHQRILKNYNKNEKIAKRPGACALKFWAKCTRACDVRVAENWVCECTCVQRKNLLQLTLWLLMNTVHLSYNVFTLASNPNDVTGCNLSYLPKQYRFSTLSHWNSELNLMTNWILYCTHMVHNPYQRILASKVDTAAQKL